MNDDLFGVLNALGLSYERRTSERGSPYAAFRLVGAPGARGIGLTALLENKVLRLTCHDIDTPLDALALVRAGARLPLGAAYRAPEDGDAELSIGVFVGGSPPSTEFVSGLLDYAVHATAALASDGPVPERPRVTAIRVRPDEIRAALAEYGHQVTIEDGAVRLEVPLSSDLRCAFVIGDAGDGWIVGSAAYLPDQRLASLEQVTVELQKLQRWATAGRFVVDPAMMLRASVPTPLVGAEYAQSIVWTASQCAALLGTAARHLRLSP